MSKVPIGETLWGRDKHEANSLRALITTIENLDEDECAVCVTASDDPQPHPLSIPALKLLVAEYKNGQQET